MPFFQLHFKNVFFCSSSLVLSINTRKYNSVFSFHLPHFHSMSEFFHLSKTQKITKIFISEINTTGFLFVVFQCAMRIVCLPHLRIHSTHIILIMCVMHSKSKYCISLYTFFFLSFSVSHSSRWCCCFASCSSLYNIRLFLLLLFHFFPHCIRNLCTRNGNF